MVEPLSEPLSEPVSGSVVHPIVRCAVEVCEAVEKVGGVEAAFMSTGDKEAALVALAGARSRLEALSMRVLVACDDVASAHGLAQSADWVAQQTRATRRVARAELALGRALEHHPRVAQALAGGVLRTEQARVIVEALDALPKATDPRVRGEACRVLLEMACVHDARDLTQLGRRILDVVAPEVGEVHEAKRLAEEEARAAAGVAMGMVDDGEGRCRGWFTVPAHVGKLLRRQLLALANPARHGEEDLKDETGAFKPLRRRLGEAFVEYVERFPAEVTPMTGGVNASVVVTMTLEQLLAEHATALLDDGTRISAGQARRLACEAAIIPVVLGAGSVPLDLGRGVRLFTKAQRIALGLRDGGCTARGCETSASGCHAHHDHPWARGGPSDLGNGRLLCPRHHRLAHDPRYAMTVHADNKITYTRRT